MGEGSIPSESTLGSMFTGNKAMVRTRLCTNTGTCASVTGYLARAYCLAKALMWVLARQYDSLPPVIRNQRHTRTAIRVSPVQGVAMSEAIRQAESLSERGSLIA